jgi:hypothetical protein
MMTRLCWTSTKHTPIAHPGQPLNPGLAELALEEGSYCHEHIFLIILHHILSPRTSEKRLRLAATNELRRAQQTS